MKEQVAQCYKIHSAQVMRFHGDFAHTVAGVLKTKMFTNYGIIVTDVSVTDFNNARDKLAEHGIFVKEMGGW